MRLMLTESPKSMASQSRISTEVNLSKSESAAFFCSNSISLGEAKKRPFSGMLSLSEKNCNSAIEAFEPGIRILQ